MLNSEFTDDSSLLDLVLPKLTKSSGKCCNLGARPPHLHLSLMVMKTQTKEQPDGISSAIKEKLLT